MDCPPTYNEAIRLSRSGTPTPTAPPLESATNFPANIGEQNDQQFGKWDEKATKIMIFRRLKMNDQFEVSSSLLETDKLWNLILLELLEEEYNHFSVLDLREYWNYNYQIYRSIVDNSSSVYDRNWIYFKPMDAVFGRQNNSLNMTDTVTDLMVHDTLVNQLNVPITSQPIGFSNLAPSLDTVVTTQPTRTTVTGVPRTTTTQEQDCCDECCNTCCCLCDADCCDPNYDSGGYSNNRSNYYSSNNHYGRNNTNSGTGYHYHRTYVDDNDTSNVIHHYGNSIDVINDSSDYLGSGNDPVGDSGDGCCDNSGGGGCDDSGGGGCDDSGGGGCDDSGGGGCDDSGGGGCDDSGGGGCDDSGGGGCDDSGGGGCDDSGGGGCDDSGGGGYDDGGGGCDDSGGGGCDD